MTGTVQRARRCYKLTPILEITKNTGKCKIGSSPFEHVAFEVRNDCLRLDFSNVCFS